MPASGKFRHREVEPGDICLRPLYLIEEWCRMRYPAHPKGCPNAGRCKYCKGPIGTWLNDELLRYAYYLTWVEFDLDAHAEQMWDDHMEWTERQCRNLLYWQSSIRKQARECVVKTFGPSVEYIEGAEGRGVDYYLTMRKLGVPLDRMDDLHLVRIIYLVRVPRKWF